MLTEVRGSEGKSLKEGIGLWALGVGSHKFSFGNTVAEKQSASQTRSGDENKMAARFPEAHHEPHIQGLEYLGFVSVEVGTDLRAKADQVGRMLNGLISFPSKQNA